jgi:hypothetical protein
MLKIVGYITGCFWILTSIYSLSRQLINDWWTIANLPFILQSILLGVFVILLSSKLK